MIPLSFRSLTLGLSLATVSPCVLTSCGDPKAQQAALEAQEEVESLKRANARLESEIKQLRTQAESGSAELMKRNEEIQKEAEATRAQFEKLQDEAAKSRKELEEYMAKYKLGYRAKLKGTKVAAFTTRDDQTFQNVEIREITPADISIAHNNGVGRVTMDKLPADLQAKFLYDPEEVKREEEAKEAAATAAKGLEGIEGVAGKIVQKDPNRRVNPVVVHNLKNRILTRQQIIEGLVKEATRVKASGDDRRNLGKYQLQVLKEKETRLRGEIAALVQLLDKELNG